MKTVEEARAAIAAPVAGRGRNLTRVERLAAEIVAALSRPDVRALGDLDELSVKAIWTPHGVKVLVQPTIRMTGDATP